MLEDMYTGKKMGIAIVGLGELSLRELLPAFGACKYARLAAVVSGDRAKARRVAREYGLAADAAYSYAEYDTLRDNPDVDIIFIVLPNNMHCEYTERGAAAGKHILCEKPMANTVAEAERMIDVCRAANRHLMIAYRAQLEPFNRAMMGIARSGALGRVKLIVADHVQNVTDADAWRLDAARAGGGPLPDIGLYCLSAARYITGEEPIEVTATSFRSADDPRFRDVEETLHFLLRFPSGVLASCTTSYGASPVRRYRVMGDAGWADLDHAFDYRGQRLHVGRNDGTVTEQDIAPVNHFAHEMDHMALRVLTDTRPYTPGEEGLQDMRLMAAIYEAARTRQPVSLPHITGPDAFRGPPPE